MTVSREQLFDEVWAEPMTKVAARYGVSSSFLARVCSHLDVPRPSRGYWSKLLFEKAEPKPVLPDPQPGAVIEWTREGVARRAPGELPRPPSPERPTPSVRQLPSRHALVAGIGDAFEKVRRQECGYLRPTKRFLVDLFVTKAILAQALDAANSLFLALERRGHRVAMAPHDAHLLRPELDEREKERESRFFFERWAPDRPTVTYVGSVAIGLTIFEVSEHVEVRSVGGSYVRVPQKPTCSNSAGSSGRDWSLKQDMPTGRLCLRAFSPYPGASWERQWAETRPGEFAGMCETIVRSLEREASGIAKLVEEARRVAEVERLRWEEQRREWERQAAEHRRCEEDQRRIQVAKESRQEMLSIVESWALAKHIEQFFGEIERRAAELGDDERALLLDRVKRAREMIGDVDPLRYFRAWKHPDER